MIVTTSAIIATLRDEDDAAGLADALANVDVRRLLQATTAWEVLDSQRDSVISRALMNLSKKPSSSSSRQPSARPAWPERPTRISAEAAATPAGLNSRRLPVLAHWRSIDASRCCGRGNDFGHNGVWALDRRRSPAWRRCEAHGYDYFVPTIQGSGGLCGVRCVELWAWTWERHWFWAFAETAAP